MNEPQQMDLSSILTLPDPTPGAIPSSPDGRDGTQADQQAPAVPQAPQAPQGQGLVFDPAIHERDPITGGGKLNKAGTAYIRKRGNGARVAKGLPPSGHRLGMAAPQAGAAPQAVAAPQAPDPQGPRLVLPEGPMPGAADALAERLRQQGSSTGSIEVLPPEAPSARPMEDYEPTAQAMAHGVWAVAEMAWGPKWQAENAEINAWSKALQRLWHHYQLPLVGPFLEVVILAFRSAAKRADSERVRAGFRRAWGWLLGRREPPPVDNRAQGYVDPSRG